MEIETRPPSSAVATVAQHESSSFGSAISEDNGQLMVGREDSCAQNPQRESPDSVLKRISEAPFTFDLFAALRLVECAYHELPRLGEAKRPCDEPIRIGQEISFAFAPADIAGIEGFVVSKWHRNDTTATVWHKGHGIASNDVIKVTCTSDDSTITLGTKRITVINNDEYTFECLNSGDMGGEITLWFHIPRLIQRVLGLFGQNGPLPLHLTEYAYERKWHEGDETFARFADIFHHRMLLLFYRAWANNQPMVSLDRPDQDHFGMYVGALCGMGMPTLCNRDSVDDFFKLAHAGIFGRQVKCAEGLQILLQNYFDVQVSIDQWVGYWLTIPETEQTQLGGGFCTLGEDAVIGERIWDCQTKFRIILGPLTLENYLRFLPDGRSYIKLTDIVKLYIGVELDWEVQLILARKQVPPPILGNQVCLGWTTWLGVNVDEKDIDDLVIQQCH